MGQDLYLSVSDESIESPSFSRSFLEEIIFDRYVGLETFLTPEEVKLVRPNTEGQVTIGEKKPLREKDKQALLTKLANALRGKGSLGSVNDLFDSYLLTSDKIEDRERDPSRLKGVLQKIEQHLIAKGDVLPLVHEAYLDKTFQQWVGIIMVDGARVLIEGDLFYEDNYEQIRNSLQVKSYWEDAGKVHFFVTAKPKIEIAGETYFVQTMTKAEQFREYFQRCYDFLDEAMAQGKQVLWEFDC